MDTKLARIYSQIPKSTCPPDCGECCGLIYPSLVEIRNIKAYCKEHRLEYKDFPMAVGIMCPYLGATKECAIYQARPFLCRILGVSEDSPCPIKKCNPTNILNSRQSRALYTAIYLHGKEKARTEKHRELVRNLLAKQERTWLVPHIIKKGIKRLFRGGELK